MKNTVFTFIAFLILVSLQAQISYKINENTYQKISISFTFGELKSMEVKTNEGLFSRIYMEGCTQNNNVGNPELPICVNLLEIPICGDYVLNVYGKDFVIYDAQTLKINYPVYPVQPPLSKSQETPVDIIQNKKTYQTDAFYALPLAQFEVVGMMRNVNMGELYVAPVQYNPVTHELKIYKTIDVEILFKKTELVKTQAVKELHKTPLFYPSNIINPMKSSKAEITDVPIKYLIVAHSMFRGALEKFISWKKRKGFLVEIGYTDDEIVGTTTSSIANFIKSHYDNATLENPAPTFVLLVGDVQQIPTFPGTTDVHPTDLYYFNWAGGNIPCCYYGRFSAQNIEQLTPQIAKTLQYEQCTMEPNYLNDIVLVAGSDPDAAETYGNGFVNYVTKYYANKENGYRNVYAHYHPCSEDDKAIRQEIGKGVGIANYTAHCNELGWAEPSFSKNQIAQMNNVNKYGLMIGNCCLSNKFDYGECFGEALLRTPEKGAVGYIGATNNTYWDEDFYWGVGLTSIPSSNPTYDSNNLGAYDRLFHTHKEPFDCWMTTFGAMMMAGNEAVQTSTSTLRKYYWEIYHLMGDPSLMTYLTKPSFMKVEITGELKMGATTLNAKVAPYSYCALTNNERELIKASFADKNGNITLQFDPLPIGEYEFSAWAQNYVHFFQKIQCKKLPFLISQSPAYNILTIESDNQISYYEIFDITGKKVAAKQNINDNITIIDIHSLANGIYIIKVIDNQQQKFVRKIMKQ
jgi:hypothetical protein